MTRLACLRAVARFERDQSSAAIDDLAAAMTLARHVGGDGLLISVLVDYAIEDAVMAVAAAYLPTLGSEDLEKLSQRLDRLPERVPISRSILAEKNVFCTWLVRVLSEPNGKQILKSGIASNDESMQKFLDAFSQKELVRGATALLEVYDRMAGIATLPPGEVKKAEKDLLASLDSKSAVGQLAATLLPAGSAARHAEAMRLVRAAMFRAGIAVVAKGQAELKREEHREPFGDGPFQYTEVDGGFELRSELVDRKGEAVTLRFGKGETAD
jgi:hypothetical protein